MGSSGAGGGSAGFASAPPVSSAALATTTLRSTSASWRLNSPLTGRSSVFWNFLTADTVCGPYSPSAGMLKPSRARFSCSVSTSWPFMPGLIVRWPNFAACEATASDAAVPGTTTAIAAIIMILV